MLAQLHSHPLWLARRVLCSPVGDAPTRDSWRGNSREHPTLEADRGRGVGVYTEEPWGTGPRVGQGGSPL